MALLACAPANAQSGIPELIAGAVALHEKSKESCFYEPVVGEQLDKLDALFGSSYGPSWDELKRQFTLYSGAVGNIGQMMGASECLSFGTSIGQALQLSAIYIGPAAGLDVAAARLMNGGGRSLDNITGKSELSPPTAAPGSADDIMADWNKRMAAEADASAAGGTSQTPADDDANGPPLLIVQTDPARPPLVYYGLEVPGEEASLVRVIIATGSGTQDEWDVLLTCRGEDRYEVTSSSFTTPLGERYLPAAAMAAVDRYCVYGD